LIPILTVQNSIIGIISSSIRSYLASLVSRIPVSANLQSPITSGGGSSSGGSRQTYAGAAAGHAHGADIKDVTRACEIEVPAHCMGTTCPLFCATFRSPRLKQTCQVECTTDKRCKIRPDAGADDPNNAILDGQNRDQLWACIAEKRDPAGTLTGRREQTWKKLETADYKKATGRP